LEIPEAGPDDGFFTFADETPGIMSLERLSSDEQPNKIDTVRAAPHAEVPTDRVLCSRPATEEQGPIPSRSMTNGDAHRQSSPSLKWYYNWFNYTVATSIHNAATIAE